MKILFLLLLGCLVGCVPFDKNGTHHYLVLGFGFITVNNTNRVLADIATAKVLGVYGVAGPVSSLSAGYVSSSIISVKTNADILINVSKGKVQIP